MMRLHNVVFDWEQQIRQKVFSTEQELKTKLEISKPIKEPYKFPSPIKKNKFKENISLSIEEFPSGCLRSLHSLLVFS